MQNEKIKELLLGAFVVVAFSSILIMGNIREDERFEASQVEPVPVKTEAEVIEVVVPEVEEVEVDYYSYELTDDVSKDIQLACIKYGKEYNISPEFLQALAFRESSYNPKAVNGNCIGLMQINPTVHKDRLKRLDLTEADLYTVEGSIQCAADYLSELFEEYKDCGEVLHRYNGNSSMYGSTEVSRYAQDILDMSWELEQAHGKAVQYEP